MWPPTGMQPVHWLGLLCSRLTAAVGQDEEMTFCATHAEHTPSANPIINQPPQASEKLSECLVIPVLHG